ncbi:hypothetical protein [Algoriphagus sp.]|uniref:hypothetical protein n=1 Tax=Algoriphagus sp. TaxID=1872435 RepID=UPI003919712F
MKSFNPSGATAFDLQSFSGKVEESGKNMETRVSGGGGGGATYQGTGGTAPISITSKTVIHDQLFLTNKEGKERSFQLQDFNLACRKGNEVTVFWGIKKGKSNGSYLAVKNHTTDQVFFDEGEVKKMFLNLTVQILLILGGIGMIFIVPFLGYIGGAALFFFAWKRWQTAKKEAEDFKQIIHQMSYP